MMKTKGFCKFWIMFFAFIFALWLSKETALAGSVRTNISESPVSTNATAGSLPSSASRILDYGENYYFNMQVTEDVRVKTGTLYIYKNGNTYDTKSYTASGYFRYRAEPYVFTETGSYSCHWVITDTDGAQTTTGTISFSVAYNVTMSFSKSSMTFNYGGGSSVNTIYFSGYGVSKCSYSIGDSSVVSAKWGEWSDNELPITLSPKSAGTTTVTVSAKNSAGNVITSKSFTVTVNKISPTLNFSNTSVTKTYGDSSFTNTLNKTTDGTIQYSSSNTSVATVSSTGLVTITGAGSCRITATASSGNNYLSGSRSYTLTVNRAAPSMRFSSNTVNKTYGEGSFKNTLIAVTDGTISYTSSNARVADVNSSTGYVTITGTGQCTITASASTGKNYTAGSTSYALKVENGSYIVTFNANGGSVGTNSKSVTYGNTYGALPTPIRTGYTFSGWYTSSSGGSEVTSSTTVNTSSNHVLYAHWTGLSRYTVTYNANGGSGAPSPQEKVHGSTLILSSSTPTRAGYTFKGWATSSSAASAMYQPGGSYTANTGVTLYAVWQGRSYTVTFSANGGNVSPSSKSVTYGGTYGALPTSTRSGYSFAGWYTSASGGSRVTESTTVGTASNHTLYAHWTEPSRYTVTYNANGGSGAPSPQEKVHGSTLILSSSTPTRTGYTFKGWATSSSAASAIYQPGGTYQADQSVTLYAVWGKIPSGKNVTVFFNANGGNCSLSEKVVPVGRDYGPLPIPIRDGYLFTGWYFGDSQVTEATKVRLTVSHVLDAHWKKDESTAQKPSAPSSPSVPSNPSVSSTPSLNLKTVARKNHAITVKSGGFSLKSATGVTEADKYLSLGKIRMGAKRFTLKLKADGVSRITYKSSSKKTASISSKGEVKIRGVGQTTITVTGILNSTGKKITKKYTLTVNPDRTVIESVRAVGDGRIKIYWKKDKKGDWYEVCYSRSRNFKGRARSFRVSKAHKVITLKDLVRNAKYYVRMRSCKVISGKIYCGEWSKTKSVTVK